MTASVQILSLYLVLRYALPMLHDNISESFKYESRNIILTLSPETTLEHVIKYGGAGVWPLSNNIYFLVNTY